MTTTRLVRLAASVVAVALVAIFAWTSRFATRWPSIYYMTGPSMEPTVRMEEYFLAWSPSGKLSRGDLVIWRFVDDEATETEDGVYHVLRRVVAFGGDTVSMRQGVVSVNGVPQPWPFRIIKPDAWRSTLARELNIYDWGPWVVSADSVMLLSDTRDMLGWPDSRFIGFVPREHILARATRAITGRRLK